ncbi:hypothetical protein [Chamaesiphon sp. VAR_69_metabat_338]|uniref:hypothetical protein n=1 Tax=Chamaesiphon sp. VAR_69_metabat_338 TaxID=2964704 RepID=UPI00286E0426|nr:hypothetical protein [Chamaesiphon sp. VAR_69_metabat_338]
MSKFTALAIGLLSVISIVPTAQAATGISNQPNLQQPARDLHAQVFIRFGAPPPVPYHREEFDRRRQWQIEREREAERRREFFSRQREREGFYRGGGEFRGEPRGVQVEFRGEPRPEFRPPH